MKVKFTLLETCEKSFQELTDRLTSDLVLTLSEGIDGFVVYYDIQELGLDVSLGKMGKALPMLQGIGTRVKLIMAFHPQIEGQAEHCIQTLEDMMRVSVIDFKGNWDTQLPLIKFAYNNIHHSSIDMALFGALYGRRFISIIGLFEVGEVLLIAPELVHEAMEKDQLIRERLKTTQSGQKSYVDVRRRDLEFDMNDCV
ncbi:hypothetical protein MTR67_026613 [Solanum verrucosum]|uniref:Uncharacterized protein n=1 Tax=Solanum verrucosum TaxID=315347 RepID=A0AAF0R369_SOLVR|nr:hypothetical protein MTR67_026613 [Solanum verrucosum]